MAGFLRWRLPAPFLHLLWLGNELLASMKTAICPSAGNDEVIVGKGVFPMTVKKESGFQVGKTLLKPRWAPKKDFSLPDSIRKTFLFRGLYLMSSF
jgi:hypothetical protein